MALTKAPEELVDKSLTSELTITTADNLTQLTLKSTDADSSIGPRLDLTRDSSSPAASDTLGGIRFMGEDDGSNSLGYVNMIAYIEDPSDTAEDGKFEIDTRVAGTMRSRLLIHSTSTIFNQDGINLDFRVESNNNGNMLFVDGGNDRLGVGTGSPDSLVHMSGAGGTAVLTLENPDTGLSTDETIGQINFETQDSGGAGVNAYIKAAGANTSGAAYLAFGTGTGNSPSERLRIDNAGDVITGDTSVIRASSQTGVSIEPEGRIYLSRGTSTGGFSHLAFYNGNGLVGTVQTSGSGTSYNESSDYRLKENVVYDWEALPRLKQLKPARFNFKVDPDATVDGFIAHEAQTVVPEAVTGQKNEVDDNGDPVFQGIDKSKLVPLLVKAVQELEAKVAALEEA